MKNYLFLCQREYLLRDIIGKPYNDEAAFVESVSPQNKRINIGDCVWYITIKDGWLYLISKVIVANKYLDNDNIWHIVSEGVEGNTRIIREIDLKSIKKFRVYRMKDKIYDVIENGEIDSRNQRLRAMRELADETAIELNRVWGDSERIPDAVLPDAIDIDEPPDRVKYEVIRIIRDTAKTKMLKRKYQHKCQICNTTIELNNGSFYIEVHHIRPLAEKHSGLDNESNMLVLCPNHHAMFDYVIPVFVSDTEIMIYDEKYIIESKHKLDKANIDYHNSLVEKKD